jgi:hypothetical protein
MKRLSLVALLIAACSTPAAAPVATPQPVTPTIAETPPPLYGTGIITFGNNYDPDTLAITGPTSIFKSTAKRIAWSASLRRPAGATSLTLIIASVTKTGVETTLVKQDVDVSNPDFDTLANAIDLGLLLGRKPGTYVMRYLRESTVLAEGTFTLVK